MKPFVFDGAFGTYYNKRNPVHESCETANIKDQETVYQTRRDYVEAGVDAVKTNTFGANRVNYADRTTRNAIIKNGYDLAVMAVKGTSAVVFADIGFIETDAGADDDTAKKDRPGLSVDQTDPGIRTAKNLD